jgi:hypothetical protein
VKQKKNSAAEDAAIIEFWLQFGYSLERMLVDAIAEN